MDGRFLESFTLLPSQKEICGRITKPLSLRHRIILTAIKSPFVSGESMPDSKDVIIFAKILSSHDMSEMMTSSPTKEDAQWMMKMDEDPDAFIDQVEMCYKIIQDQAKWPVFWESKKSSRSSGSPWVLSVVCNLVKNGVPLETAWIMPESQAIWMNAVFSINAGAEINIVSEDDKRAMEQLKEIEERIKSGQHTVPDHPLAKGAKV